MTHLYEHFAPSSTALGTVIGTYGSLPFIHLHLELRKRLYPSLPLLVHDDASPEEEELQALCKLYDADFLCAPSRGGHYVGDLRVFARGLEWAQERHLDVLVKFSRRFLPLYDWRMELSRLVRSYPYATFSGIHQSKSYQFGFLTEALALVVAGWTARSRGEEPSALERLVEQEKEGPVSLVEGWVHDQARFIHAAFLRGDIEIPCLDRETLERVDVLTRPKRDVEAYGFWPITGGNRERATVGALWHSHPDAGERYALLARLIDLPYTAQDFDSHQTARGT